MPVSRQPKRIRVITAFTCSVMTLLISVAVAGVVKIFSVRCICVLEYGH